MLCPGRSACVQHEDIRCSLLIFPLAVFDGYMFFDSMEQRKNEYPSDVIELVALQKTGGEQLMIENGRIKSIPMFEWHGM